MLNTAWSRAVQQFPHTGVVRFAEFEIDLDQCVLRKRGLPVRLQAQPFQVLAALLEKPGAVVTREDLRRRLWPEDTFVDFEHGLNAAVTRLRQALGDSAGKPRYIETLAKRGYRFCAEVEGQVGESKEHASAPASALPRKLGVWIYAGATLATCASAFFLLSHSAEPVVGDSVPLTTFRGIEEGPAVSPDGNHVAFSWNGETQDNFDIYVMPIQGAGTPVRLTSDPAEDVSPAWSPDGRTIAFLRRLGDDNGALMLVQAAGGPEHKLHEIRDMGLRPIPVRLVSLSWSRDGRWIAASHRESEASSEGLHLFSLAGESRQLTAPQGYFGDHMPAFSPDGRALAFHRLTGRSSSEIYVLPVDTNLKPAGEACRLTDHKRWSRSPVWANGGRTILYVLAFDFAGEVRSVDVSARHAPSRKIPITDVAEISLSHDLVYSRQTVDTNIWRAKIPAPGDPPTQPERLISSTRNDDMPEYSPDGQKIAFRSTRSGSGEIWVSKADGSSPVRLTFFNGPLLGGINWSPDGQSLVFMARPEGQSDLFVIPAAGGSPKRLTEESSDDSVPSFSRDGRWIYFASTRSGQGDIWRMPAKGGEAVRLTWSGGWRPLESLDGKTIYYFSNSDAKEILSIPVDGSRPVKVVGPTHDLPFDFTVTAKGVYYPAPPHAGELRFIRFLDVTSGQSRPVAVTNRPFFYGMSVSPDGRYVLFDQFDESGSDLMLVKNFLVP